MLHLDLDNAPFPAEDGRPEAYRRRFAGGMEPDEVLHALYRLPTDAPAVAPLAARGMTGDARLLRVADLLRRVPMTRFSMENWELSASITHTQHTKKVLRQREKREEKGKSCGFAGCAVGHAMHDPVMQAQGLVPHDIRCSDAVATNFSVPSLVVEVSRTSVGRDRETADFQLRNWDAVSMFFDVSEKQANYLFSNANYQHEGRRHHDEMRHPAQVEVAERIEEFVEQRRTVPAPTSEHVDERYWSCTSGIWTLEN